MGRGHADERRAVSKVTRAQEFELVGLDQSV
jgi:hypothetical protein